MKLDRIYTRGGDEGRTSLGDGTRVAKHDIRVRTIGGIDEANATIGVALLHIGDGEIREVLVRVQNDLFDLGADLCCPEGDDTRRARMRMTANQVETLERQIDRFNAALDPLTSFVLPGGSPGAAHLHLARAVLRRAECDLCALAAGASINREALKYVNRLSDLLFVLARTMNEKGKADVLWKPGVNR